VFVEVKDPSFNLPNELLGSGITVRVSFLQ
jgi:hypothetical protein